MNGTSYVNGVSSLEPESPKSHWSDLTGATSESDAADNEDGSLPTAPVQPRYGTRSAGIPLERDGLVELCETRPRTSDTPSGAQTGDTAGLGEDSETNRARVENDVRLDPVIQDLPTIPPLFDEGISPMIPTPKAKTPTSDDRGEEAHESEASNKDSMPATQKTATAISTRATSNEQDDEMVKAGNMPTMTTGMSANETSTDDEPKTANTGTSSGQPDFWTATDRRSTQIPLTEQQARQGPFSVFLTHRNVKDVPQQRDRDVTKSNPAGESSAEQRRTEESSGTPQTKPIKIEPPEPITPPSKRIGSEASSGVQTSTVQSPPSSQKRRRASNSSDGETPAFGGSRKRATTRKAAGDTRSSPGF